MVRNYTRGYNTEIRVVKYLESLGYFAERNHASKGVFDVWASNSQRVLFIQCKRVKKPIKKTESIFNRYKEELLKISQIPMPGSCMSVLAHYTDRVIGESKATLKFYKIYPGHLEEIEIK